MRHLTACALVLGALATLPAAGPLQAQSVAPMDPACAPLVGTYLSRKANPGDGDPGATLMSLTAGGQAFMDDAAQGGIAGYQPFTTARGAWVCGGVSDGQIAMRAVMVDFTHGTAQEPAQKIVRVATSARLDPTTGVLEGTTEVFFYPIQADPLAHSTPFEGQAQYTFQGTKITAE